MGQVGEIVGPWLAARRSDADPQLLGYAIVGLGEAAARALLGGVGTPEELGAEFGRLAARALPS